MFFINQINDMIGEEKRAFKLYLIWLLVILFISIAFIIVSWIQNWLSSLGPTLSSAFLLLLSKPPFTEMMKRKDKIKTLKSLQRMAELTTPESKERVEIEKLVLKTFRQMLK